MRVTRDGIDLIRSFESCALTAYLDQDGRATIGWGRARGIRIGDTCTQEQADQWFLDDLNEFEGLVLAATGGMDLTDNQLSALVSFAYNVGWGVPGVKDGFRYLKDGGCSTLLKCVLARDMAGAAAEFPKWNHAGGKPSPGLTRRRAAEAALFLKEEEGMNG